MTAGSFIISIDFELWWGLRRSRPLSQAESAILAGRLAVPALLDLFTGRSIHATWATVGLLGCDGRDEAIEIAADCDIRDEGLLQELRSSGLSEAEDPCRFAPSLIQKIVQAPFQELATHTFSHLPAFDAESSSPRFLAELRAAKRVSRKFGADLKSLVFPQNESTQALCQLARNEGIVATRGNPPTWTFDIRPDTRRSIARRGLRWLDAYVPLFGNDTARICQPSTNMPVNVPASRFLRPVRRNGPLASLEYRRIESGMTRAAREGLAYHLWFHEHNFPSLSRAGLDRLERILDRYLSLKRDYGMKSRTMHEAAADHPSIDQLPPESA